MCLAGEGGGRWEEIFNNNFFLINNFFRDFGFFYAKLGQNEILHTYIVTCGQVRQRHHEYYFTTKSTIIRLKNKGFDRSISGC